jgi:hypothetical protein
MWEQLPTSNEMPCPYAIRESSLIETESGMPPYLTPDNGGLTHTETEKKDQHTHEDIVSENKYPPGKNSFTGIHPLHFSGSLPASKER